MSANKHTEFSHIRRNRFVYQRVRQRDGDVFTHDRTFDSIGLAKKAVRTEGLRSRNYDSLVQQFTAPVVDSWFV